jgi:hypothetical protein
MKCEDPYYERVTGKVQVPVNFFVEITTEDDCPTADQAVEIAEDRLRTALRSLAGNKHASKYVRSAIGEHDVLDGTFEED